MMSPTILLIHPPAGSPVLPCWDAAVVAGCLAGSGFKPVHYDANLDFYRAHLFSKAVISSHFQLIQKKKRAGLLSRETYSTLKKMYEACETGVDINGFKGKDFYDPTCFLSFKNKINACLTLAFHAYSQASFHRSRYGEGNPFYALCEQGLEKTINRFDPERVIFFVSSPHQVVAAETMANYIKSRYPVTQVLAMTKPGPDLLSPQSFDHILRSKGRKSLAPLAQLINSLKVQGVNDPKTIVPDYGGVSLDQYLIPDKVVLVHPFFFKNPVLLSDFLEDQVRTLGVKGFVFAQAPFCPEESGGDREMADAQEKEDQFFPGIYRHLAHWLSIKQPRVYFSLQVRLGDTLEYENILSDLFSSGLRLINWEGDTKNDGIPEKILWKASKKGIWNHLTVPLFRQQANKCQGDKGQVGSDPAKFIVNSPNIVHSYQDSNQGLTWGLNQDLIQDESATILSKFMDYAKVKPVPGIPFWNLLGDTGCLLVYLSQLTKKSLICLRADVATNSIFSLGSQMIFTYQSPKDLPPGVLDEICKMVEAGGSVDTTHVRSNLEKAFLIGYAMENKVIIGNSSLKHPRKVFIKRLKQMTEVDFTNFVERGYTSVRPEYRAMGVGAKLLEGLTKRAEDRKVFSIISEENLATQKIAIRNNTKKNLTYFSEKLNKEMGVWMPRSMIDNQKGE